MSELFFEIGSEELPAKEILSAVAELAADLARRLDEARLGHGAPRTYATPRRLVVVIPDVEARQPDRREEVLGPPAKVGFKDGQPTKAAEGFAKKQGLPLSALFKKETPQGEYVAALVEEKGRLAQALLPEMLAAAIAKISWKRSMRWGSGDATFARPIQWIVALYAGEVLRFSYGDVESGRESRGHRFLAPGNFSVVDEAQYLREIEARKVVVDVERRKALILSGATERAESVGGDLYADVALLDEVAELVEWPVPMLGSFDAHYLEIPQEVLISEMREHLRYFSVVDDSGKLLPNFVVVANTKVEDPQISLDGYRRVLSARFQDGRFFFTEDQKSPLWSRVERLKTMAFHRALGTQLEKVERVVRLAFWLAAELGLPGAPAAAPADPLALAAGQKSEAFDYLLARAGYLMKADLTTLMVFEFPELQGAMGRAYALRSGEPAVVAHAIEEHYWPKNAGERTSSGELKGGVYGGLLGLADRLDSIVGIFATGKGPTGTADPFGLRRAALGILTIAADRGWHVDLPRAIEQALQLVGSKRKNPAPEVQAEVAEFFRTRMKGLLTQDGVASDVAEAVLAARASDVLDVEQRAKALASLRAGADFSAVAEAFKRVANILRDQKDLAETVDAAAFSTEAERMLWEATSTVEVNVQVATKRGAFDEAFAEIARLRLPLDRFFKDVMVMDPDLRVRQNRVALLAKLQRIFAPLADLRALS